MLTWSLPRGSASNRVQNRARLPTGRSARARRFEQFPPKAYRRALTAPSSMRANASRLGSIRESTPNDFGLESACGGLTVRVHRRFKSREPLSHISAGSGRFPSKSFLAC